MTQDPRAIPGLRASKDQRVLQVGQDLRVFKVLQDQQVGQGQLATQDQREIQDHKVFKVLQDQQVGLDLKVFKDQPAQLAIPVQ